MNWGWKIAILYGGFVLMMSILVYLCVQQEVLLVTDNYYEKDLEYNKHLVRLKNTHLLEEQVKIAYQPTEQQLRVQFPKDFDAIEGYILLYRPSKTGLDIRLPIQVNADNQLTINTHRLIAGRWRVKINWEGDGQLFYKEEVLTIETI